MAAFSRLGAWLACVLLASGCGKPSIAPVAPATHPGAVTPVLVAQDGKSDAGGAVSTALRLTEVQLMLVQAFRAIKAGDADLAYNLLNGAKEIAQAIDLGQLSAEQKDRIKSLVQFLGKYDRDAALAALTKVLVNEDPDELTIRAKVLIAMKHWYSLGRAVLAKNRGEAVKELMLAHQALEAIDFDRLDEHTRDKLQAIKERVDKWVKLSDKEEAI